MNRHSLVCATLLIGCIGCERDPYQGWQNITSAQHKFKIKIPGNPESNQKKTAYGKLGTFWETKNEPGLASGTFGIDAVPAQNEKVIADQETLDAAIDMFLDKVKDAKVEKESEFLVKGKAVGREVEVEIPRTKIKARVVVVIANGHVYGLQAIGGPSWRGWSQVDRFFKSFELTD